MHGGWTVIDTGDTVTCSFLESERAALDSARGVTPAKALRAI